MTMVLNICEVAKKDITVRRPIKISSSEHSSMKLSFTEFYKIPLHTVVFYGEILFISLTNSIFWVK